MLDCFLERDVPFVTGSDGHAPGEIERRVPVTGSLIDDRGVALAGVDAVVADG